MEATPGDNNHSSTAPLQQTKEQQPAPTQEEGQSRTNEHGHRWKRRQNVSAATRLNRRKHFIAVLGEFVGTFLFLFFAFGGTNVANTPSEDTSAGSTNVTVHTSQLLYISLSFGISLAVTAWVFFRISGGLFNPAVSLGLVLAGAISPLRGVILTIAQILGAIAAAGVIEGLLGSLNVRTTLDHGMTVARGLFLEMFLTAMLMFTILLLAVEKHRATFLAPIGIGLALFIAEMVGVYYTGGSLNPARSFGPDVVLGEFAGSHWIYWVGPFLGSSLAAAFYRFIKWMEYEVVNPKQDATGKAEAEAAAAEAARMEVEGEPDLKVGDEEEGRPHEQRLLRI
ncbi:aquaporin-like protein [Mrakia frigida]|uniref:aquaporin-like protein n=1 Tax=Mrakia frigida TaxID=29902 RepID=UPI003FCC0041